MSARFKGISLRTQILSFLDFDCFQYFGGIHLLKFSITCVFVFVFLFSFSFLGDKHGCLISEIRPWQDFCLKTTVYEFQELCCRRPLRTFPGEGRFPCPPPKLCSPRAFSQWTVFSQVPMLDPSSHQTSSYEKEKKKTKKKFFKKSLGYLVVCTVAIFSSKNKTLYKLWARFIRKRHLLLTRDF